jgi:hypothetical protein
MYFRKICCICLKLLIATCVVLWGDQKDDLKVNANTFQCDEETKMVALEYNLTVDSCQYLLAKLKTSD